MSEQLLAQRPLLRPEISLGEPRYRGADPVYLIVDRRTLRCFEMGPREQFLLSRLDGDRSLSHIGQEYRHAFGRELAVASWVQLLGLLFAKDLLVPAPGIPAAAVRGPQPLPARKSDYRVGRLVLASTSSLVDTVHRRVRWVFHPMVQLPVLVLLLGMLAVLAARLSELLRALPALWQPGHVWWVLLFLWFSLSVHEVAHGVTAHQYGGRAPEIGVLFRPPMIFLYCRVDGAAMFPRRGQRVATAAAGAWVNLVLLLPIFGWWLARPDTASEHRVLSGLLLAGAITGLVNLVPLPPLDGYKMLGESLGVLELSAGSNRCARELIGRLRHSGDARTPYPAWLFRVYLGYVLLRVTLLTAVGAAVTWYCLAVLPVPWGPLTLAAAIAFALASGVGRFTAGRNSGSQPGRAGEARARPSRPPAQEVQPSEVQPGEAQPSEVQPSEAQPSEVQPGEAQPSEVQPSDAQPRQTQPR